MLGANKIVRPATSRFAVSAMATIAALLLPTATRSTLAADSSRQLAKLLLIVAPDTFRVGLQEYVVYKKRFQPTEFVALQEVLNSTAGVDDPERLKRLLYAAWKNRNLGYVLLVGDRDIMPVR
jgi:Peptidase family C25